MDYTIILGFFSFLKLVTIFAFVLAVIFIANNSRYRRDAGRWGGRQRENNGPNTEEQTTLDDIGRVAEKMERRLEALEKILEADDPRWKERAR